MNQDVYAELEKYKKLAANWREVARMQEREHQRRMAEMDERLKKEQEEKDKLRKKLNKMNDILKTKTKQVKKEKAMRKAENDDDWEELQ
ncbi:unnamed protein product [Caenorhabditis sp. 36 PRJEB53466]|nr:unnamed protein product [Caenorhabditis sp. 36 PRJEB53466]